MERLGAVSERYSWRVLAYCLMTTHTHLLVEARTRFARSVADRGRSVKAVPAPRERARQ